MAPDAGFNTTPMVELGVSLNSPDEAERVRARSCLHRVFAKASPREQETWSKSWEIWGRQGQKPPEDLFRWRLNQADVHAEVAKLTWLLCAGRGVGKTRVGSQMTWQGRSMGLTQLAGIARTARDARFTMVEGESGILSAAVAIPWDMPTYSPGNRTIEWSERGHLPGCLMTLSSAAQPEQVRGNGTQWAWMDETATFPKLAAFIKGHFLPSLRGKAPAHMPEFHNWILSTTTPLPTPDFIELFDSPRTHVTSGSTRDNIANLNPSAVSEFEAGLTGNLAQQELHGVLVRGGGKALWRMDSINLNRLRWMRPTDAAAEQSGKEQWCFQVVDQVAGQNVRRDRWEPFGEAGRVVIGVDPATETKEDSDLTGIVVVMVNDDDHIAVLADLTDKIPPADVVDAVAMACRTFGASAVAVETNQGGAWVVDPIRANVPEGVTVNSIWSAKGKKSRALQITPEYNKGKIHHLDLAHFGEVSPIYDFMGNRQRMGGGPVEMLPLGKLEDQMTTWDGTGPSPDHIDALVFACLEAMQLHRKPGKSRKVSVGVRQVSGQGGVSRQHRRREIERLRPGPRRQVM